MLDSTGADLALVVKGAEFVMADISFLKKFLRSQYFNI